ncbi:hypothetical protein [Sphingobium boeckii]|uniref:Uncharacterized protein n=1 Tax=Sphingobium boeckii TaxID=1082345 RepID=A0A7W9EEJ9_9SPHN|nr:hypothetical protein [Sphingobium boeckii]MBB5686343.1 hypothetical protein [Sphingobium boeckii]
MSQRLPDLFASLELYVDGGWSVATQQERNDKRCGSTLDELNAFYCAMMPHIAAVADYLNHYPLEAIPPQAARLLQLGLMLMEIAPAVEVMKSPDIPTDFARERLIIHPQIQNYKVSSVRAA